MIGAITQQAVSRLKEFTQRAAVVGVLSLAATWASAKEIYWTEQVRLSSGEVIVVERGETLRSVYDVGAMRAGWLFDEAWLKGTLPGVGETRWQGWVSPLVLDVTPDGQWYLLAIVVTFPGQRHYQLARTSRYVAFTLQAGVWQRIPFAEFPEQFQPNLLADTSQPFLVNGTPNGAEVDFDMKRRVDSVPTLGKAYKRIDRSLGE